jgi:hypothetical protein
MAYGQINVDKMVSSDNVTSGGLYGFKNRIINGAMMIDQRNAGNIVTGITVATYTLDRWRASNNTGTARYTVQQNSGTVTPPTGFTNYIGVVSLGAYSVGAGEIFYLNQTVEGYNIADLGWGTANAATVTLSFWVRSSLTGTFGGALQNSGSTRSYPYTYTINAANTWEQKTITIAGDTSGTWPTVNGVGVTVTFGLGVGTTFSGTAGSWAGADYRSATGATSVVGTNGATFYITGVQLEKGSTATSFDYRPYGTELALCQRYLPKIDTTTYRQISCDSASASFISIPLPITARVAPTGITANGTFTVRLTNGSSSPSATVSFNSSTTDSLFLLVAASSMTAGQSILFTGNAGSNILGNGCEL